MTLIQLSASYRQEEDTLRRRIQLVRRLPTRTREEEIAKLDRLRVLTSMRRDVRAVAVVCERYYEPGYRVDRRYAV